MRAYVVPPVVESLSLARVELALQDYAPDWVTFSDVSDEADLVVLHAIGRRDALLRQADVIRKRGQRYAVIQYCVKSTKTPDPLDWLGLWESAALVWSYYDLPAMLPPRWSPNDRDFAFYHAPLGSDAGVFHSPYAARRRGYTIMTTGQSWLTESVRECAIAANVVDPKAWTLHLGPDMGRPWVRCVSGISDMQLADLYGQCQWVSGLRRIEGFELPAVEGLLCGARPVLFDRAHYRSWYGDLADYIPEAPRPDVIDSLRTLFARGPRAVTCAERARAAERFDWHPIIGGFWERLR